MGDIRNATNIRERPTSIKFCKDVEASFDQTVLRVYRRYDYEHSSSVEGAAYPTRTNGYKDFGYSREQRYGGKGYPVARKGSSKTGLVTVTFADGSTEQMTSEEYDKRYSKKKKIQHSYAGKKSAAADMSLFERAEAMEAEGAESEELDVIEFDLEMILGEDFDIIDKALMEEAEYINSLRSIKGDADLNYYNTAGEIEAYDVGERVDLDAEARRAVRPDIDRDSDDVKFADPNSWRKMHAEDVDIYTEEQYNNFGWARETEAITKSELDDFYSVIKDKLKSGDIRRSSRGEYIVEVNNKPHTTLDVNNVFVFFKGDGNNPQITRVIRAEIFSNTEMELYRDVVYGREEGVATAVSNYSYFEARGILREYTRRDYADFDRYLQASRGRTSGQRSSQSSGADRSRSDGARTAQGITGDAEGYLKTVDTFYDISGEKHEIVKIGVEYYIRGNHRANPQNSIQNVVDAENNRVIQRYSRLLDRTAGWIRSRLEADPDFLKKQRKQKDGRKIQYSRKAGDSDGSERKVLLPLLNRERFKIYTQENAEQIVSSIVQKVLRFNDGTQGVIKNKAELVDMIWRRLNTAEPGKRGGVALDIAEEIIQRTAVRTVIDDPANAEYVEKYKKRSSANARGSQSSNISLRDATAYNNIISQNSQKSTPETKKSRKIQHSYSGGSNSVNGAELIKRLDESDARRQSIATALLSRCRQICVDIATVLDNVNKM